MTAGIVVTILALFVVVSVTGKNEGMAIWEKDNLPEFALWDGNEFSEAHQIVGSAGTGVHIRGAYSPVRDEAIVMIGNTARNPISAHIYSGGQWSSLPFSPIINTTKKSKTDSSWDSLTFDVHYESKSGNPLLVWFDATNDEKTRYASRTGSNWTLGIISTPFMGQEQQSLYLEANPKSNDIVLAIGYRVILASYVIVWDGDSWSNAIEVKKLARPGHQYDNIAYEQQSGRAIMMYADGRTNLLNYRFWNGVTWGVAEMISPPPGFAGPVRRVMSCADPSTNRIVAVMTDHFGYGLSWVAVWDGSNNWESMLIDSPRSAHLVPKFAVAFEGTSQRALAAYTDGTNEVKYRTWSSSSGWSDEERGPKLGDTYPNSMMLSADKESNDIMLATKATAMQAYFCRWNGTGWGEVANLSNKLSRPNSAGRFQSAYFMWKLVSNTNVTKAPSAFPTRHPTSPPTSFPTPAPSIKPTPQLTDVLTPQPTRTPTSNPSASPTSPISTTPALPNQSQSRTKNEMTEALDTAAGTVAAGRPCESSVACKSRTCRNGVCMATSACYPVRHRFGEPFFEHKVNIVFVASGFDTATKEMWHAHVNRTDKSFEEFDMLSNEVEQLNMFRVDPWELDSSYCAADCLGIARLLCCDQNRALRLAEKCFPVGSNLQTVVIHNDERYGGAGYVTNNIATVTTHPMASLIAAHELGHSLFDLTDEYSYGSGTDAEPNCDTNSSCYKWSDLIGNTPAGYDPVKCLPGCRNNNFYVGSKSFMHDLYSPMGAVNDRFTCCTYCALTKSFPSYCDVFDQSPNYLFNYCSINDYQGYGSASYEKEPLLAISDGLSVQDPSTKYVQVEYPVSVKITTKIKRSGKVVFKSKQAPLEAGMFLRSLVEGDFSSPRMARKLGFDSVLKVVLLYRADRQTLFISPNITIEVPMSQDPIDDVGEPLVVSEQADSFNIVADTKGKPLKRVRVKVMDLSREKGLVNR